MDEIEKELQNILNAVNVIKGYFQAKRALLNRAPLITRYGKKIKKRTYPFMILSKTGFPTKKKEKSIG